MNTKMDVQAAIANTPPESFSLKSNVSKAVWYPLTTGFERYPDDLSASTTVTDKLGNGPTLTSGAAITTEWANWGALTPLGASPGQWVSAAGDAYVQSLFRMDTLGSGQILIGMEVATDGALSATETLFNWGRHQATAGSGGAIAIRLQASSNWMVSTHGGNGSATTNLTLNGAPNATTSKQYAIFSGYIVSGTVIGISLSQYIVATGVTTYISNSSNVGILPAGDSSSLTCLFARQASATPTFDTYCGAATGSNAKVNNLWAARLTEYDAAAGASCLRSLILSPREFPLYLRSY